MYKIEINLYYTHLSFILFLIGLLLPCTFKFKYFIILNSIIVGIAGNLIIIKNEGYYIQWYKDNYPDMSIDVVASYISASNFILHTIPMIVSLLLLPSCVPYMSSYTDTCYFILIELVVMFLWSLIPYHNKILINKLNCSYQDSTYAIVTTLIVIIVMFFFITYYYKNISFPQIK
jgi:hypothetical protein